MKLRYLLPLLVSLVALSVSAQPGLKRVYDENINPLERIDNALSQAKEQGKFVICQVGGNWCPWCLRFAKFITDDEEINEMVNTNFVYIHVNYNPHADNTPEQAAQAEAMMKRLGSPSRFGFPVFVVLDAEGKVLHIQDSAFLEEGKGYHKDKVLRFFMNWTPKALGQ